MSQVWMFPCRIQFFDVIDFFNDHDVVLWNQPNDISEDDTVFIYVGAPLSCIMFRCKIKQLDVKDKDIINNNSYAVRPKNNQKFMQLERVKVFEEGKWKIQLLREYGHGQFQKQCKVNGSLAELLLKDDI